MTEEFDIPGIRYREQREVIVALIEIVHKQEEKDFDSFFNELVCLGEETITIWADRFHGHDPIEKMSKEEHDRIRPKLCMMGFANKDVYFFRDKPRIMLLDLPPKDDYSVYATSLIDGERVKFISRIQGVVERFLMMMEDIIMDIYDPRTDSNLLYMTMLNIWENFDKFPIKNIFGHFVFTALVTFDREVCTSDNPYSGYAPLYEETLARLFKRVISDKRLRS